MRPGLVFYKQPLSANGGVFICAGGRGRRLPVAIVLRFDRVGRRESVSYGIMTYISFDCRGGRGRPPVRCSPPTAIIPRDSQCSIQNKKGA